MYKYFKLSEFDSPDRPGTGELMEHEVVEALDVARDIAGFPFIITSGFRTVQAQQGLQREVRPSRATCSGGRRTSKSSPAASGSS